MGELVDVADLLKVAVEDERTGVAFYQALEAKTANAELKRIYADLAEQEKYHQQRFENMLHRLAPVRTAEEYPGQYVAYLGALTRGRAFPDQQTAVEMARRCATDIDGLSLAERFERDTLILLSEMRALLPEKDSPVVAEVTQEEQSHLVALGEARIRIAG